MCKLSLIDQPIRWLIDLSIIIAIPFLWHKWDNSQSFIPLVIMLSVSTTLFNTLGVEEVKSSNVE